MPTMTNPETGETKEISMEEFLKMMRSGNGSIQQVVTHADGSTSSTTIFGNIPSDGLDRSVNIFVDSDTFNAFITRKLKKMTGQMPDPESEKAPLELFEMTIDFTHAAIMGIVRKTKEELSVKLYTRNEQKATFDYLLQSSKTWKVNEDGSITFNVADLQGEDKTISLYMLSFLEMRQFLRASGKLAELKELGNRGTGVIIKATGQADDATATIVRGLNRPNLPCEMFLLGEQMMRPYPDEMFSDAMASTMTLDEKIEAAENGDPDMMELLAQQYLNGDEVEQDFVKSAYWWQKLADTGNAVGQFNIGLHYAKGCGVTRDFQKAAEWMRLSAENGDEDAPNAAENYSQAYSHLQKANAGDAAAQAAIAKLYMQIGGSLEQYGHQNDYAESFKWAQKAAAQGNLDGMYCLALCYEHGRGTAVSKIKAADTYKKAAEQGHAPSQWNLAVCYMNGYGYERNEVTGYMWAYRAADQDYDLAVDGLSYQDKLLEQLIENYEDSEAVETLEGTQYEGRAARCESLKAGTSLTPKITKDKNGDEAIELFYNGGSVGLLSRWNTAPLLALLKLERIDLKVTVKSCIPKSKRGPRARNADVKLKLAISERKPETPEEKVQRLKAEAERRAAEEERMHKDAEEAKLLEGQRRKREEEEKAAAEKAAIERQAATEARREYLKEARQMITCKYDAYAYITQDCRIHVVHKKTGYNFEDFEKNRHLLDRYSDYKAVALTHSAVIGLRKNGTCIVTFFKNPYDKKKDTSAEIMRWRGITKIATCYSHVVGLREDGTCVCVTLDDVFSLKIDLSGWSNIKDVACGHDFVVGLTKCGTVLFEGKDSDWCERDYDMEIVKRFITVSHATEWQDISVLAAGGSSVVGITKDGTLCCVGSLDLPKGVAELKDIVQVEIGAGKFYFLLADGRVYGEYKASYSRTEFKHLAENVIAISRGDMLIMLKEDGKLDYCQSDDYDIPTPRGIKLFDSYASYQNQLAAEAESIRKAEEERIRREKEEEAARIRREKEQAEYRQAGVCQHCGGTFKKSLFSTKCTQCGKKKDY